MIDVVCPQGHIAIDVYTTLDALPVCGCGLPTQRAWLSSAAITPNGTRPERNTDRVRPKEVNTKAIAEATTFEIEQKWQRFGDEKLAEQHVSRETNHKAGIADELGNPLPIPKPEPISFPNPKYAMAAA